MQTPTPTTINTDLLQALISLDPLIERIRSIDSGTGIWEHTKKVTDKARAAVVEALFEEVLEELIYAHTLIRDQTQFLDARAGKRRDAIVRAGGSL